MIIIRPASPVDIPHIVNLIQELAADSGETSPVNEAFVAGNLSSPCYRVLVAVEASRVAGLLSYSLKPSLYHAGLSCMVEELVVAADIRSQGVGSALLSHVMKVAESEGWAEVSVGVMPDNLQAQAFYRRHGLLDQAILLERHIGEESA